MIIHLFKVKVAFMGNSVMDSRDIDLRGRQLGLSPYILNSPRKLIIRSIQRAEGEEVCFLTDARLVCNKPCEWSNECKKLTASWLR